mmetsp:Transcript_11679/g.11322  ORF Transcript_11679/g.11322 Transcript_11679/m.11322 type:complete len:469 (+) Transcript_11679:96-1502(+)
MFQCARPNCHLQGKSSCSGCGREQYCGSECQKLDWKIHKSLCPFLKKLSNKTQPYHEALKVIDSILQSKKANDMRVLEHLLSYVEYQFELIHRKEVTGIIYYDRGDGQRTNNWDVDILIFYEIYRSIISHYIHNHSISDVIRHKKIIPYLERSILTLTPWLVYFDSSASNCDHKKMNTILEKLCHMELEIATATMRRLQLDVSEGHCQRGLNYSKRLDVEGKLKATIIFRALRAFIHLRQLQDNHLSALIYAEEGYNFLVDAYDPVHPEVQEAAGLLIDVLIMKGDLDKAETYAQQTYSNLKDKKNGIGQETEDVARGAFNLAEVIFKQQNGNWIKAEKLAREAISIRSCLVGNDHGIVGVSCNLLSKILRSQNKLGDETKKLHERSLEIFTKVEGPDGINTASVNFSMGTYHRDIAMSSSFDTKRAQLLLAKKYVTEAVRIYSKRYSPTHQNTIHATSELADILKSL